MLCQEDGMQRNNKETWLALLAAAIITAVYAFVVYCTMPYRQAGSLFGHLIGVLVFC